MWVTKNERFFKKVRLGPFSLEVWKCHDDYDEDDYPWLIYLANPQLVRVRIDEHPPATLLPALKPL